ncbi:MAG: hypothetical protein EXQ58_05630 [Acidobacteria bacterium]|nr:hypothetical protein [Acidobacteriota bacterium]
MYRRKGSNNSRVRLTLVVLMGIAVIAENVSTSQTKEKISKPAMKEMIAGAKTAADHKAIADYYHAEAAKARAKAVEHDEMVPESRRGNEEDPLRAGHDRPLRAAREGLQVHSGESDCSDQRA